MLILFETDYYFCHDKGSEAFPERKRKPKVYTDALLEKVLEMSHSHISTKIRTLKEQDEAKIQKLVDP